MSARWVDTPEHLPRRCAVTSQSAEGMGPYLEAGVVYFEARPDEEGALRPGGVHRLYLARSAIREACELPGSPLVCLGRAEHEAGQAAFEVLALEKIGLEAELDEARAQLELAREAQSPETLAGIVAAKVVELSRPRRSPKRAA